MDALLKAKKDFTPHELNLFSVEYEKKKISKLVTWLLWLFSGIIGGHRYYLGHIGKGIAMTLTLGGLGIWAIINAIFINKWIDQHNESVEKQIIDNIYALRNTAPPRVPPA